MTAALYMISVAATLSTFLLTGDLFIPRSTYERLRR